MGLQDSQALKTVLAVRKRSGVTPRQVPRTRMAVRSPKCVDPYRFITFSAFLLTTDFIDFLRYLVMRSMSDNDIGPRAFNVLSETNNLFSLPKLRPSDNNTPKPLHSF